MATKKPRVYVTLDPADYAVARDLAELNGQSVSSVLSQAFHDVAPMLANVVRAGRAFRAAQEGVRGDIRAAFQEADQVVAPEIARLQDDILTRLQAIAEMSEPAEDPRPVIRGSRTPTPHLHPVPKGDHS